MPAATHHCGGRSLLSLYTQAASVIVVRGEKTNSPTRRKAVAHEYKFTLEFSPSCGISAEDKRKIVETKVQELLELIQGDDLAEVTEYPVT